jgi:hypothetical protein
MRRSNADWRRTDRCWDGSSGPGKYVQSKEAALSVINLGSLPKLKSHTREGIWRNGGLDYTLHFCSHDSNRSHTLLDAEILQVPPSLTSH